MTEIKSGVYTLYEFLDLHEAIIDIQNEEKRLFEISKNCICYIHEPDVFQLLHTFRNAFAMMRSDEENQEETYTNERCRYCS